MNGDPVPAVDPQPANKTPATVADLNRLRRDARDMAVQAYRDAVHDVRARNRDAVKAAGWALLVCVVAALVIWSWLGSAYRAVRRAGETL